MLAHYLLYIGRKLRLQIPDHTERMLLDAAHKRWEKEGLFLWFTENFDEAEHRIDENTYLATTELDTFPEIASADWTSPLFASSDCTAAVSIASNSALDICPSDWTLLSCYADASNLAGCQSVSSINALQNWSWANNFELEYPHPGDDGSAMTEIGSTSTMAWNKDMDQRQNVCDFSAPFTWESEKTEIFDLYRPATQCDPSMASTSRSGKRRRSMASTPSSGKKETPRLMPRIRQPDRCIRCWFPISKVYFKTLKSQI